MRSQMGIQAELLRTRDMQITELEAQLAQASQALQDLPQQLAAVRICFHYSAHDVTCRSLHSSFVPPA